jgi:peptidoglycan/xylan/chitin deacetylase (PgdA/CDA1 family)
MIRTPLAVTAAILAALTPLKSEKPKPVAQPAPKVEAPRKEIATPTPEPVVAAVARPEPPKEEPTPAPALKAPPPVAAGPVQITYSQCHVDGPYIAMTFDDGPHGSQTPRLLKMLKQRNIKATFFLVGKCVAEYPEIARQIVREGHEVANHSWDHPLLSKMAEGSVREQLQKTHDVIKQTTGVTPTLMRPPYGGFTANQRSWSNATLGYKCILWDVDSLDWQHRNPAKTESIIFANTKPGSIVLCHDIHKTTIDAMEATLDGLAKKGFKFVTVSELIAMNKAAAPVKTKPAKSLSPAAGAAAATSIDELAKPAASAVVR